MKPRMHLLLVTALLGGSPALDAVEDAQVDLPENLRVVLQNTRPLEFPRGGRLPRGDWIAHGFSARQRDDLRAAFRRGLERKFIPGGSLLLMHRGEVIFREGFGVADLETKRPFTAEDPCFIASVTKPHTSTVLAILADRGKLSLEDPVEKHLPEFRGIRVRGKGPATKPLTIAHALSHTTGFPGNNAFKAGKFTIRLDGSLADAVAHLATMELLAEPGTRYAYSRTGYLIAARVAEVVTGKPFPVVMRESLLEPIGTTVTTFEPSEDVSRRMPVAYERDDGKFRVRDRVRPGTLINPGGGLVATLDDVARLMKLHRDRGMAGDRRIVSARTLERMYVPRPATPGSGYGLGFNIMARREDGSTSRIRHIGGSGTLASVDFDSDLIVVLLTQVPQQQTIPFRRYLMQTIEEIFARR